MSWKTLHASAVGTSHLATATPCQDAADVRQVLVGEVEYLLIAICDGAGSAACSHEGASLAVRHWLEAASEALTARGEITEETLVELVESTHQALVAHAEAQDRSLRDYACTLLAAVLGPERAMFLQVGDGVWVMRSGDDLAAVTWPHQGEYAGETVFLTSPNRAEHYQIVTQATGQAVAGLTDGLERLALDFSNKEPARGFFVPMWGALESNADPDLSQKLEAFLGSEQVNNRTDDDKTLVLAVRMNDESQ